MSSRNRQLVDDALQAVNRALGPMVERRLRSVYSSDWLTELARLVNLDGTRAAQYVSLDDVQVTLKAIDRSWSHLFKDTHGPATRDLVRQLRGVRNDWAHQSIFSEDQTAQALTCARDLLDDFDAGESREVESLIEQHRWTGQDTTAGSESTEDPSAAACPKCGAELQVRTARRGANAGGQFLGCPNFNECGFRGAPLSGADIAPPASQNRLDSAPRVARAEPARANHVALFYEHMTVRPDSVAGWQERLFSPGPFPVLQWKCEYMPPRESKAFEEKTARALAVLDKLLNLGRVTTLSPQLEGQIRRPATPAAERPQPDPLASFAFESEEERVFYTRDLADALGRDVWRWVTPQVHLATLAPLDIDSARQLRVDFLIAHPSLERPLVVEIDGLQHEETVDEDEARAEALARSGYAAVRIPASEVRAGEGAKLEEVRELLRLAPVDDAEVRTDPVRRAGQIQEVLLHAVHVGLIDPSSNKPAQVFTDLVDSGDLTREAVDAILADFADVAQRVGRLYGVDMMPGGLAQGEGPPSGGGVTISFYGAAPGPRVLHVDETCLPFHTQHNIFWSEPGLPTAFTREDIEYFLTRIFRKTRFNEGQFEAIDLALQGRDAVLLLPTGAGKSIAFQLAALLLPGRCLVVDPLISLIRDQVEHLQAYGIDRVTSITSELRDQASRATAYELLLSGDSLFYYVAPERLQMTRFREQLRAMIHSTPISLIVVDEAHCVSEWGHDFRTSYLRLGRTAREVTRSGLWIPPLMALTGTASRSVLKDAQRELEVLDVESVITPKSFDRPELHYTIVRCDSDEKDTNLKALIKHRLPGKFGVPSEAFFRTGRGNAYCGLVFCPHVNYKFGVDNVAEELRQAGVEVGLYSTGIPRSMRGRGTSWDQVRRDFEKAFKGDELPVLVCTNAFGMGIDKANVRYTIHYGLPGSIEAFYQEAGRAGRDRAQAECILIVSDETVRRMPQLLSPQLSVEDVEELVAGLKPGENDDVVRTLWFHGNAFPGEEAEVETMRQVLEDLRPASGPDVRTIERGESNGSDAREKALHRLLLLGVVEDYTVDHASKTYGVKLAGASGDKIIEAYTHYVSTYQEARALQERAKAEQVPRDDWESFALGVSSLLVRFIYEVIEQGRRRAIAEMVAACRVDGEDEFRSRVLRYLEASEYSERLEALLADASGGLGAIPEVMEEVLSPRDASEVRGQVSRYLESYPDQPALLMLRALSEAVCDDTDWDAVEQNLLAFLESAVPKYGATGSDFMRSAGVALRVLSPRNADLSATFESLAIEQFPAREALRMLVATAEIRNCRAAPFALLASHASMAASAAKKH